MTTTRYKNYMQSSAWKRKKASYWKSRYPKNCYVCGADRHKGMHLHHRTYVRLTKERLSDLVPVCKTCHEFIHNFHQSSTLSLEMATAKCRGALQGKVKAKPKPKPSSSAKRKSGQRSPKRAAQSRV